MDGSLSVSREGVFTLHTSTSKQKLANTSSPLPHSRSQLLDVTPALGRTSRSQKTQSISSPAASPAELRNVEDAMAYFLKHGANSHVKFVYLKHAYSRGGELFRPYDLIVVPDGEVDLSDEHFVMSVRGITHLMPTRSRHSNARQPTTTTQSLNRAGSDGGRDAAAPTASEFYSLSEWARHTSCFNVCVSLRVFRDHVQSKAFRTWVENVRFQKYCKQRAAIRSHLISWKPAFVDTTARVLESVSRLKSIQLVDVTGAMQRSSNYNAGKDAHRNDRDGNDTARGAKPVTSGLAAPGDTTRFTLPGYLDAQAIVRTEAAHAIEREVEAVRTVLEQLCKGVTARAHPPAVSDEWTFGAGSAGALGGVDVPPNRDTARPKAHPRHKSMAVMRAEAEAHNRALQEAAEDEAMLGPLIRMVDALLVETLAAHATSQVESLHKCLRPPSTTGLLYTSLGFDAFGDATPMKFSPSCAEWQSAVDSSVCELIKMLSSVSRVLFAPAFRSHTARLGTTSAQSDVGVFGAWTVSGLLAQSEDFATVRAAMNTSLASDYTAASEYARIFESVRPIYNFTVKVEGQMSPIISRGPDDSSAAEFAAIQQSISQTLTWKGAVDSMRSQHVTGSLYVDSRPLKDELQPVPASLLQKISFSLVALAKRSCSAATAGLITATDAAIARTQGGAAAESSTASHGSRSGEADATAFSKSSTDSGSDAVAACQQLLKEAALVEDMYRLLGSGGGAFDIRISSEESVALDDMRVTVLALRVHVHEA